MDSEELWRAALHDFNNLMAGLQGVLDLSDPGLPMDPRNRLRLGSVLEDGKSLIAMAQALALGRLPEARSVPWAEWEAGLRGRLEPMSELFRCPIELVDSGARSASWPAPLLQDWAATFTRQILPWAVPGPLRLEAEALPDAWVLRWITGAPVPQALQTVAPPDSPRNLASGWLRSMADHMGLAVEPRAGSIQIRVPRPSADLFPPVP